MRRHINLLEIFELVNSHRVEVQKIFNFSFQEDVNITIQSVSIPLLRCIISLALLVRCDGLYLMTSDPDTL